MKLGNDPRDALVISSIERAVLDAQAERLGPAGAAWLDQCRQARVAGRSHSGVGFVTRFEVPPEAPALADDAARRVGAVHASHPALREPAEFLIQLKHGRLASIEAFCFDGLWPADDAGFRITSGGG
jgi:hypothetical protein